jgi:hypothetical protein
VKRLSAMSVGVALLVTLTIAGAAGARTQATRIQIATALTAAQEIPAPTGDTSAGRGTFTATIERSGADAVVTWQLSFSGLTGNAVAAHIHTGARGVSGPVSLALCGPCTSPASGTGTVSAEVLAAIQAGGTYVNVHTPTNGAGEIRGQVGIRANVRTPMTSRQEVPKPKGSVARATGTFTGTLTKAGTTVTLSWRLNFARLTGRAVAAHIHTGARGKSGPVSLALCGPCRNGQRGTATLRPAVVSALESGRAYVNVHTSTNAAGEIRGQIAAVPLTLT